MSDNKSIYDIKLNSADGDPDFLKQFKNKVTLVVNTTVGCGNANQLEILQRLQDIYGGDDFQVVAIPTNDYCGAGITKGKWAQGITCGADSKKYGEETYNTTFQYSEMVSSIPNSKVSEQLNVEPGHNGLGQPNGEPHDLYKTIQAHQNSAQDKLKSLGLDPGNMFKDKYISPWLSKVGFYQRSLHGR